MKHINNKGKMKNATVLLLGIFIFQFSILNLTSCSDMLEVDSTSLAINPEIGEKTDSVFYAYGIAQAMQQVADQYFFQGEMRGELISATQYADTALLQLQNFTADLTNKYDSAYAYYRVINNCNYYLAYRDTTLYTGSVNITTREYAAVLAYRAWAYLQLCRNYGSVPFYTEPLTTISQINDNQFPTYNVEQVTAALAPEMQKFSGTPVPDYGANATFFGKNMDSRLAFIPIDVVLGDLYLESGQYQQAANSYVAYLLAAKKTLAQLRCSFPSYYMYLRNEDFVAPSDLDTKGNITGNYSSIFYASTTPPDVVSYIPLARSRTAGATTAVPAAFGYNYYALNSSERWNENVPLLPSDTYKKLTDEQLYYYYYKFTGSTSPTYGQNDIRSGRYGDMRAIDIMRATRGTSTLTDETEDLLWIDKFESGNIILYRASTIYLHLCEALNHIGLPDLAFNFLKEGIQFASLSKRTTWLSQQARDYLYATLCDTNSVAYETFYGNVYPIHAHGCGATSDGTYPGSSPYQYSTEIMSKAQQLITAAPALCPAGLSTRYTQSIAYNEVVAEYEEAYTAYVAELRTYNTDYAAYLTEYEAYQTDYQAYLDAIAAGETATEPIAPTAPTMPTAPTAPDRNAYDILTKADTVFVMDELLCDEEAMEFCFEGTRWYDLMRFARHKNRTGLPGNAWLADKVKANQPQKNLTIEQNWFLPFKR